MSQEVSERKHGWPWNERAKATATCKMDGKSFVTTIPLSPAVCGKKLIIYWPKAGTLSHAERRAASLDGLVRGLAAESAPRSIALEFPSLDAAIAVLTPGRYFAEMKRELEQLGEGRVVVVGTKSEYLQKLGTIVGYCSVCRREQEDGSRKQKRRKDSGEADAWLKANSAQLPSMFDGIYPQDPKTGKYVRSVKVVPLGEAHGPLSDETRVGRRPLTNAEVAQFFERFGTTFPWNADGGLVGEIESTYGPEFLDELVKGFALMSAADLERRLGINRMTIRRLQQRVMGDRPELLTALKALGGDIKEHQREGVRELLTLLAGLKSLKS